MGMRPAHRQPEACTNTKENDMATAKEHPAVAAIRKSGAPKVKVAVSDIDGILRGKYLHRDKFLARPSRTPRAASASATWCSAGT
jgi:hypothetical protein